MYNVDELKCPLCLLTVDNEVHFVLCGLASDDFKFEFVEPTYLNNPCGFRLTLLLGPQNEYTLRNLALFLYNAFNSR